MTRRPRAPTASWPAAAYAARPARPRSRAGPPGCRPGAHLGAAGGRGLLALQATAGNAAVTALVEARPTRRTVQRLAGGADPTATGTADAAGSRSTRVQGDPEPDRVRHARDGEASAGQEQGRRGREARQPPAEDREAQAKAAKAATMGAAPSRAFDKAAFVAAVKAAIARQTPKTLDEADKFATSGKSDAIAAEVKGKVGQGKDASAKPMAEASAKPPDTSRRREKPVIPLAEPPAAAAPPEGRRGRCMPAKAPPEQTDLGSGPAETDQKMAEAGVTEDQLGDVERAGVHRSARREEGGRAAQRDRAGRVPRS